MLKNVWRLGAGLSFSEKIEVDRIRERLGGEEQIRMGKKTRGGEIKYNHQASIPNKRIGRN